MAEIKLAETERATELLPDGVIVAVKDSALDRLAQALFAGQQVWEGPVVPPDTGASSE
jgi:hypothetical protein